MLKSQCLYQTISFVYAFIGVDTNQIGGDKMNTFCPLIKEKCRGSVCMMWKDEKCLVITFMENFSESHKADFEEHVPGYYEREEMMEKKVPDKIKSASPEELAAELVSFAKTEFPDEKIMWIHRIAALFWKSKKIDTWDISADMQLKIEKAQMLAQKQLDAEREIEEKRRIDKEKAELPSLINSCVAWTKEHGFKKVTQADVDAFLLEKNIDILPQTKRSLYIMVNVAIKSTS